MKIMNEELLNIGQQAKRASYQLTTATETEKNEALLLIADQLLEDETTILKENKKDLDAGEAAGFIPSVLDRMMLDAERIEAMAEGIRLLVELENPVGEVIEHSVLENGLVVEKQRVPIGVIGMIFESRPNVTIDAATLSLKTGNAVILRGSSSAIHSNKVLVQSIQKALDKSTLPVHSVQLIEDTSREVANEFFRMDEYLDILIPRGSEQLIQTVLREATVPVIETGAGNCHAYIDASADEEMATEIVLNAKLQRPSVCNAIESLLIQKDWFAEYGSALLKQLQDADVEIIADTAVREVVANVIPATEEDWGREYLDLKLAVKLVDDVAEAIDHINTYGTHHSESIVTADEKNAQMFLQNVDASTVYHNASTRFTDGFEFGYGAEIGISTQKLHARGPMGLQALTSTKFVVVGDGQVRS